MSKYYDFANDGRNARFYDSEVWKNNTKECALICINEMIDNLDCFVFESEIDRKYQRYELMYLREVKQELEKL